jgi:hypothetical protein
MKPWGKTRLASAVLSPSKMGINPNISTGFPLFNLIYCFSNFSGTLGSDSKSILKELESPRVNQGFKPCS